LSPLRKDVRKGGTFLYNICIWVSGDTSPLCIPWRFGPSAASTAVEWCPCESMPHGLALHTNTEHGNVILLEKLLGNQAEALLYFNDGRSAQSRFISPVNVDIIEDAPIAM